MVDESVESEAYRLSEQCSQLFERGEMRGLAIILRDANEDEIASRALIYFLRKHGDDLSSMIEGKPSSLGITFDIKTDGIAKRSNHTKPYKLAEISEAIKVGRLMMYAGASDKVTAAVDAITKVTNRGDTWVYNRWTIFNDYYDNHLLIEGHGDSIMYSAEYVHISEVDLSDDEIEVIRKQNDPRRKWQREYETGKVSFNEPVIQSACRSLRPK